jgi:hypothetical protein
MQDYFVLSFSNTNLYHHRSIYIIPSIETEGKCVFECYLKDNNEKISFTYNISCINSLVKQLEYIFDKWESSLVVSLHNIPFSKKEYLDHDVISYRLNGANEMWCYKLYMKNKTCKKIIKSIVNA